LWADLDHDRRVAAPGQTGTTMFL